ncbi:hypothetical protein [Actinoplanes flavus]|uniref:Uncharacterized protein n=1 Tax=Actinoplanes flavus TaxID=2820290 RepID=A0ABS3UCQ6_9ACTN|nr:hypothetical protein [Actinoplanes flavus]MBO3736555.1 hypothetical protein [Actinoplanes flavus]
MQTVGAALLGVATAMTATRQPFLRIITAVILGSGYALVANVATAGYLTIAYILVLAWWAATTAIATIITGGTGNAGWITRWLPPSR